MIETIVITTAELVGAASGLTWNMVWSFAMEQGQLNGSITVSSEHHAEVRFTLEPPAPWLHEQWAHGGFEFMLDIPKGGGSMDHIPDQTVWALNGGNWLVPPLSMGSGGAGKMTFYWNSSYPKLVPASTVLVEANWQQTPNMVVRMTSTTFVTTWDLKGNGAVGMQDLLIMLAAWDNPWTIPDLVALLSAWSE